MKKITPELISSLRQSCYDKFEFEMIDQKTREDIKWFVADFLISEGYNIGKVKSDQENNPCSVVDSGRIIVHIFERSLISNEVRIHTLEL